MALAIAMALGAVSLFFAQPIITLCFGQLQPATMAYACAYLRISAVSYPALALYNGGAADFRERFRDKGETMEDIIVAVERRELDDSAII